MKTNLSLSVTLSLILAVTLCVGSGCKKDEPAPNPPPETAGTQEQVSQPAQTAETPQAAAAVRPAPDENTIAEGHAFPSLEFVSLSGEQVSLANLKGKVVLIDFWATWCGPCRNVMPDLVETYKQYHDQGFEIIGISLDEDKSELEKYMQDKGITWQQYFDGLVWNNKIARRFGVRAIPHIVLVDRNGAVHFNTNYNQEKPPLHGVELRNAVAWLCGAPAS